MNDTALREYRAVSAEAPAAEASPHQVVALLMQGALDRMSSAKGCMARGEVSEKGAALSQAITLLDGLRAGLDAERGGEIARNLDALYGYLQRRLVEANLHDDRKGIDEAASLLAEIRAAWIAIASSR